MRIVSLVAALPALAAAQDQIPLGDQVRGWFDKVKSFVPSTPPAAVPVENVAQKAAGKIAEKVVTPLTLNNWESVLEPSAQPQEWLVYVTGGNKTCLGRCGQPDKAWTDSVPLFAADPTSPNLASLDCEKESILCSVWAAGPPTVWHFQLPQVHPGEARPPVPLHIVNLNHTTVTPATVYEIHGEKTWQKEDAYEGLLHPFDGQLAEYGLNVPLGYVMYGFSVVPSWLMMIGISFLSRTVMGRRMRNPGQIAGRGGN
jgi:PTH2 family peptidyl-tRNA hydrolase